MAVSHFLAAFLLGILLLMSSLALSLPGLTLLQDQGCFVDRASSADMESRGMVSDLTRERCLSLCAGYQYVGVQVSLFKLRGNKSIVKVRAQ